MAKPNYQFEKRQRDLEKKKKKEEKAQRKQSKNPDASTDELSAPPIAPSAGSTNTPTAETD